MMANSKYASTRETTNLARVARVILGPCTDVLCAVLTKEISPPTLLQTVKTYLSTVPNRKQPPITKEQERIIHNGNYSDFDITLLYFLLRNISNIPPHAKQWGNEPNPSDRSVSANIERIRLIRNKYGHFPDFSISDTDFNQKILEILGIIQDLENYLGTSAIYQDAVVEIRTCCMDPEQESRYIKELLNLNKQIKDISEERRKSEKSCVPKNVRALYDRDISKWKEDDCVFLETHNFPAMLDQVRSQPYVTFVSVPGSGKTATARHIALKLQTEGYDILPVVDKNKIEDYCNSFSPQVFVIDDVLGVFGLSEFELHMINKYCERFTNPINPKTKILMTCREAVFRNKMLSNCVLVKDENIVNLQSKNNALNDEDKQNLLEKYQIDRDILTSNNLTSSSNMFPFLCKLFSSQKNLKVYGPHFFISPVPCILKEMNSLKEQNKYQYASLVLLMGYKNKLSEEILNNETNGSTEKMGCESSGDMKRNILRKCKVPSTTDSFQLIDALSEMEGTYTKKIDDEFTFIHDSMFEIIAYHFGNIFPELILQYGSSDYIANYIMVTKNNIKKREIDQACEYINPHDTINESETIVDLCIHLHESLCPKLAEPLFKDLQNGEFYRVFGNEALKHPSVLEKFIDILNKTSYNDLCTLLISEFKNSPKLGKCTSKKNVKEEQKYRILSTYAHDILLDERSIRRRRESLYLNMNSVRGIKWIILFGHYHILQCVLNQMIQKKGNVDDLFLNCYNKNCQIYSRINQRETGANEMNLSNHSMTVESYTKPNYVGKDTKTDIDTERDTEISTNSGSDIDIDICIDSDTDVDSDSFTESESDIEIACDTGNEPVIVEQCRLLCLSCYSGDLDTVQLLLKHVNTNALNNRIWPSKTGYRDKNPLTIACEHGHLDIVKQLLKAGANINMCIDRETPLIAACKNGHQSIVRELLKSGASVNKRNRLYTPLQCVCEKGHTILADELIKAGADVNLNTPLINACKGGHLCIVEKLIDAGAGVNISKCSESPILAACEKGHFNVVKELISAGADVNKKTEDKTPLISACDGGYFNVLKLLMRAGAKFDANDKYKTTFNFSCYWNHLNIIKRLMETESNADLKNKNEISFIAACDCGQLDVVREMIKGGADVNEIVGNKTPLITAIYKAHAHIVKELIEAGADVNLENEFISPLQVACYEGHFSIIKELYKAEYNGTQISGAEKALMGACFFGHVGVVKELITCHVEVNLKHEKETPLTTASFMGHLNILKALIKAGACVNLSNGRRTPLALAYYRRHFDLVKELIKEGADVIQSDGTIIRLPTNCDSYVNWIMSSKRPRRYESVMDAKHD